MKTIMFLYLLVKTLVCPVYTQLDILLAQALENDGPDFLKVISGACPEKYLPEVRNDLEYEVKEWLSNMLSQITGR